MARRDWWCEDILSGKIEVSKVNKDARGVAFHHPDRATEVHVVVIP
jgi:diadenosine tetraphosphate (Ap4A) HIT family hydrolase